MASLTELAFVAVLITILVANLGLRHRWAAAATTVILATMAMVEALGASLPTGQATLGKVALAFQLGAGALALALLWPQVRSQVARFLPIDVASPVHTAALALCVLAIGSVVATQLGTNVTAQMAKGSPLSQTDLILGEVPYLPAALLGVGLGFRRGLRATSRRLGLVRPRWWHPLLALACAAFFWLVASGLDLAMAHMTPHVAHSINAANRHLFSHLNNPLGIASIAVSAGICEEILFRGAIQSRLGIPLTSILFAVMHMQYGLSLDTLAVFILAVGLSLIRRYTNTTTAVITHVAYDLLAGMLP